MNYDLCIALYLRLSQEDVDISKNITKDESNSIHSQKLMLQRFVENNEQLRTYKTKLYIDDGYTGTNFDRPQFKDLLNDIKKKKIYCIIVKDLSRFGRNFLEVGDYLEHIFPLLNIRFISVTDNYDSNDYIGTTGGIEIAFKNLIHQKYSQDSSEKVKAAMHLKMSKGQYVTHCPYGYMKEKGIKHKMIIDPEASIIVKEIFSMCISGMSSIQIAKNLNNRQVPTPEQHRKNSANNPKSKGMWSHQAVLRIIKDYKYTGAMVNFKCENETIRAKAQKQNKPEDWVVVENMHDAIISHEDFELANSMLRKVKPSVKKVRNTDRIDIYCFHCGRKLRTTYGLDEYYTCVTSVYKGNTDCSNIRLVKHEIEAVILETFQKHMSLIAERFVDIKKASTYNPKAYKIKIQDIQKKISANKAKNFTLYEMYKNNEISANEFTDRKADLVKNIKNLNIELEQEQNKMADAEKKSLAINQTEKKLVEFTELSELEQLDYMRKVIDKVLVRSNNDIEVLWKSTDIFNVLEYKTQAV